MTRPRFQTRFVSSFVFCCGAVLAAQGQQIPGIPSAPATGAPPGYKIITPAVAPTLSPGVLLLIELEGRFASAVAAGGGKAFGAWFAEDAVTLNNGKPAVLGRGAIAASANWNPKEYSLTWAAQGAQMGPSNDMGFTWGHYEGKALDRDGKPVITTGRYITVWKKLADGTWKVAMDASANEPAPDSALCCTVPQL
jgi:ketosteroid isomerase-like protein